MDASVSSAIVSSFEYTCPKCGQVVIGTGHVCSTPLTPAWNPLLTPIIVIDEETKYLLERIANALEKIAAR